MLGWGRGVVGVGYKGAYLRAEEPELCYMYHHLHYAHIIHLMTFYTLLHTCTVCDLIHVCNLEQL